MAVIGITGGIGSGKSTFRDLLAERLPAESFDADRAAAAWLDDPAVRDEIRRDLHPLAYREDGVFDRAFVRDLVFRDPARRAVLETILHPRVREDWTARAAAARSGSGFYLVDIPLLFETAAEGHFDRVVVVACSPRTQLDRLVGNRGLSPEIGAKMIASQMSTSDKVARSHHVIWNDGSASALTTQADLFSSYLHARYG